MITFVAGVVIGALLGAIAVAFMISAHLDDYDDRPTGAWKGPWQ